MASHKTARQVAEGEIPERNIMRCRWIYTWKSADVTSPASPDGKKAKARLVVLGFEDPDLDKVRCLTTHLRKVKMGANSSSKRLAATSGVCAALI